MRPTLLIGTATTNGIVAAAHVSALMAMTAHLGASGIATAYRSVDGPNLATQRDLLADDCLRSPATHLLLLDGDLHFTADLAERLLALDEPLVGAAYALSGPDLARAAQLAPRHGVDAAIALASPWNVAPLAGQVGVKRGRARVASLGSGCLLIRRDCLEALASTTRRYRALEGTREVTAFFRALPHERHDPVLQDRICVLWAEAGGAIWIDVEAQVTRLATFRFGAPFSEYLRAIGPVRKPADAPEALAS